MPQLRVHYFVPFVLAGFVGVGCAYPVGSRARPAKAMSKGQMAVGVGGLVPIGFIGQLDFAEFGGKKTTVVNNDVGDVIPAGSFDYAIGDGELAGVDIAYAEFAAGNLKTLVINPRFEYPFGGKERSISLTLDGNFMYFKTEGGSAPFIEPMIGIRGYFDFDFIGFTFSQSFGTTFVSFYAPGGVSVDVPIPFGEGGPILHIMPEFKWDPVAFVAVARFIMFSAGGVVMLEF